MEPKFETTFIPKGPALTNPDIVLRKKRRSLLFNGSIVIFFIALLSALGLFGYETYLKRSITDMNGILVSERANYDFEKIDTLKKASIRMTYAEDVLNNHKALSLFLTHLEEVTLTNVRWRGMTIVTDASGRLLLNLTGEARSYASVALQEDAFAESGYIKSVVFSALSLDPVGNVIFNVNAEINQAEIRFAGLDEFKLDSIPLESPEDIATSTATTTL